MLRRLVGQGGQRAELVLKQLTLKFGTLPDAAQATVRAATSEELDRYAERLLSATSLDEVLTD